MPDLSTLTRSLRKPRSRRWIALLIASVLLHVIAFDWMEGSIRLPSWHPVQEQVVMATLRAPPTPAPLPVKPRPAPPHPAAQRPAPTHEPHEPTPEPEAGDAVPGTSIETPTTVADALPAPSPAPAAQGAQAADKAKTASTASPATPTTPSTTPPAGTITHYRFNAPPSAELQYDVEALREGQTWHGKGVVRWEPNGDSYSASAEASIRLFVKIRVLYSASQGKLKDFGIAPVLYSEQPFHKSMTNTHFQQENGKITFSASQASYPYLGGEQDRVSVLFQLAGIGRANSSQYQPGAQLDLLVAGSRDLSPWAMQVIGEESIELPAGQLATWHVVRVPRPGSYEDRIDIWLAPQREWYPVRVRYTYVNKDYIELSLSEISPVASATQ